MTDMYFVSSARNGMQNPLLEAGGKHPSSQAFKNSYIFKCMDVSGCQAPFPPQELPRFASEKMLSLRDKLASEVAIREAEIDGFVTCPFCDFGAILEDMEDKEFRCMNSECEVISCRSCRLESHLPLSCEGPYSFSCEIYLP